MMGAGLRPSGKPLDQPPYPKMQSAPHFYPDLQKLKERPALIVWGMKDFAFRDAARKRFEQAFPRHKTVLLANASHFLQEDAGEQIAEEIKAFLSANS